MGTESSDDAADANSHRRIALRYFANSSLRQWMTPLNRTLTTLSRTTLSRMMLTRQQLSVRRTTTLTFPLLLMTLEVTRAASDADRLRCVVMRTNGAEVGTAIPKKTLDRPVLRIPVVPTSAALMFPMFRQTAMITMRNEVTKTIATPEVRLTFKVVTTRKMQVSGGTPSTNRT